MGLPELEARKNLGGGRNFRGRLALFPWSCSAAFILERLPH